MMGAAGALTAVVRVAPVVVTPEAQIIRGGMEDGVAAETTPLGVEGGLQEKAVEVAGAAAAVEAAEEATAEAGVAWTISAGILAMAVSEEGEVSLRTALATTTSLERLLQRSISIALLVLTGNSDVRHWNARWRIR